MRLRTKQIEVISKMIVEKLIESDLINIITDKEKVITKINKVITGDLLVEEKLDEEVKQFLKGYSKEIEEGRVDHRKMFNLIKNKLIRERNLVLY